jgi:hypothetical protein
VHESNDLVPIDCHHPAAAKQGQADSEEHPVSFHDRVRPERRDVNRVFRECARQQVNGFSGTLPAPVDDIQHKLDSIEVR